MNLLTTVFSKQAYCRKVVTNEGRCTCHDLGNTSPWQLTAAQSCCGWTMPVYGNIKLSPNCSKTGGVELGGRNVALQWMLKHSNSRPGDGRRPSRQTQRAPPPPRIHRWLLSRRRRCRAIRQRLRQIERENNTSRRVAYVRPTSAASTSHITYTAVKITRITDVIDQPSTTNSTGTRTSTLLS